MRTLPIGLSAVAWPDAICRARGWRWADNNLTGLTGISWEIVGLAIDSEKNLVKRARILRQLAENLGKSGKKSADVKITIYGRKCRRKEKKPRHIDFDIDS